MLSVLLIVSEIGIDMSKWRSAKAFCSWLGLCPGNKISGGKVLDSSPAKSPIEWQTLYDWPLNRWAVPRPAWASSSGVSKPILERPRPPLLQRANWLASFTTCSNTNSPTKNLTQPSTNFDSKNPRSLDSKTRPLLWATNWFQPPPFPSNRPVHLSQVPWKLENERAGAGGHGGH